MNGERELALAAYAAARDAHVVAEPRSRHFARFVASFDAAGYRAGLERQGLRWIGRGERGFPALLGAIHDPPAGLFLRGAAPLELLSRPCVAVVGARAA